MEAIQPKEDDFMVKQKLFMHIELKNNATAHAGKNKRAVSAFAP